MPAPNRVVIEVLGADDEWSIYKEKDTCANNDSSALVNEKDVIEPEELLIEGSVLEDNVAARSDLELPLQFQTPTMNNDSGFGFESSSSLELIRQPRDIFFGSSASPRVTSPASMEIDFPSFTPSSPSFEMNDYHPSPFGMSFGSFPGFSVYDNSFLPRYWPNQSPFSELQTAISAKLRRDTEFQNRFPEHVTVSKKVNSTLARKSPTSSTVLVQSLLRDASRLSTDNSIGGARRLPDTEEVLDSLLSLLPESQSTEGQTTELAIQDSAFDTPFYRALIFSMANGFAGLKNIPPAAILRVLRKEPELRSQIFEYFQSSTPVYAKSLADTLFRAAVEACDEEAVNQILQATRSSPNAIDPNEITCTLGNADRLCTPIELAAKFRHLGIVKTLLAAGADVNKTYIGEESANALEHGALELAVRKWGDFEAVDMTLVRTILDCDAEVRLDLINAVVRWGHADLLQALLSRFPRVNHRQCFQSETLLKEIACYLDNSLATQIIRQVFRYCTEENCGNCSEHHQEQMEVTLCNAARRGNLELVHFLLPRTTSKGAGLSAAVRNNNRELVYLFIQAGASVCEKPFDRREYAPPAEDSPFNSWCKRCSIHTTPLAEALRVKDTDLVHEFEERGALSNISQDEHFQAVVVAAAEVGDCQYIRKVLERVPNKHGRFLTGALATAIYMDETEAALMLLDNGAEVNQTRTHDEHISPLREAIKKRNRAVVYKLLEADIRIDMRDAIKWAIRWGDKQLIEDMVLMGPDHSDLRYARAIEVAAESRRTDLVELLFKLGASYGDSALSAAVDNNDNDMIQLLMSRHVDPANELAMLAALDKNQNVFKMLLKAFCARYLRGKMAFGGNLLATAIKRENIALFDVLLAAKFDVRASIDAVLRRDESSSTPLGFAIQEGKGSKISTRIVQKLIDAGAPPNGICNQCRYSRDIIAAETALIVAIKTRCEDMVQLLIDNGADVCKPARLGIKRTPLQKASEIGSFKMVRLLLDKKVDVNESPAERSGGTALQLAASSGSIKIAELLLSCGADVHGAPSKVNGRTALEGAAENGCVEMIRVLWDAVGGVGFTPEMVKKAKDLAMKRGHRGCAEYIDSLWATSSFPLLQTEPFMGLDEFCN
jgi:ankyrin repeat protein